MKNEYITHDIHVTPDHLIHKKLEINFNDEFERFVLHLCIQCTKNSLTYNHP